MDDRAGLPQKLSPPNEALTASSHEHMKKEHTPKGIVPLDALRGLAVILVVINHFAWSFTPHFPLLKAYLEAGWIGVDLFFVL